MMFGRGKRYLLASSVLAIALQSPAVGQSVPQHVTSTNAETIVITGTRNQAKDVKKQANVIIDVAPLEQIRSLPDANAAEALQRLPGISMESDSGAGRFINIRGMDADLNGTTFDGVRMMANNPASPQGGARAVAFDAFPAGILGGLEVIKSLTPEMDAEGLGGVVNIQPRTIPQGMDHVFDVSLGGGIETLRKTGVYKGDITVGKRFMNGKLSIIASYAYFKDDRGIDDIEADYINDPSRVPAGTSPFLTQKAYDDVQYRWYQYHRTRQGYGAGITYDFDANSQIYARGFHAGYVETANKHEFVLNGLADPNAIISVDNSTSDFTSNGVSPQYADINTKEKLGNDLIEVGGHTIFAGGVKLDARGSWTRGTDKFPYSINARFADPAGVNVIYNNSNADRPTYRALGGVDLTDPSLYSLDASHGGNGPSQNNDREYAAVANVSVPANLGGGDGEFKFGGSVRERKRTQQQFSAGLTADGAPLTDYVSGPDITYYHGWYNIGPQPIYSSLLTIPESPLTADPSTYEDDNENIYGGYAQYSGTFGKLSVVGGVRVERTDGTYRANQFVTVPDPTDPTNPDKAITTMSLNTDKHAYTNVFPDLSFKYDHSDVLQFRAAFSTAIARPGFNQITAARSIDTYNATPRITQGNPNLKPTLGRSVDLSASYFLPNHGLASIGLFYKAFSNYIIPTETNPDRNVPGFVGQNVDLTSYSNVGSAHADGVELTYDQQFDFLPGMLSGFGFEGNLTYVESSGEIRPGEKHRLPQTSPFNYNAAVFYNHGPLYLKLAASYVSTNLWAVGDSPSTDLYSQPRFRLDFGASYDVTKHVKAYFDLKNITNTHLDFTQTNSRSFPVQNEFYGMDILGGVRINFGG